MRILLFSDNFPPESNAPANRALEHGREWVRAGHQVTVITCAPNFPQGRVHAGYRNRLRQVEVVDGIRVVRVKTYITANQGFLRRTLDYISFMLSGFIAGIFEPRPDVVIGTSPQFFAALGAWMLATVKRTRFVMEVRDLWPASIVAVGALQPGLIVRCLERIELMLYRRAAWIVVVTRSFREDLVRRGVPASKISVVFNGVDVERFRPEARDPALAAQLGVTDRFVVGYLGTVGMAHAVESIIEAAALLRDEPRVAFLIVGAGARWEAVDALRRERDLQSVVMRAALPRDQMPALWSQLDLALVHLKDTPVFATVIPSKVFEAMAMARPLLVAAPEGELCRIVRDAGAGRIVPPEDPAALATAVRELLGDEASRTAHAQASAAAATGYARSAQARRMLTGLERLTQPAARATASTG